VVIRTTRSTARLGRAARLLLLLPLSDLIAHDAIYANGWGIAGTGAAAHSYWPFFGLVVGIFALSFLVAGANRLRMLRSHLETVPGERPPRSTSGPVRSYHRELLSILALLVPLTLGFFLLQENVESVLASGIAPGLAPVLGANALGVILIAALASLTVAMGGALVRWRIAVLEERLAHVRRAGMCRSRVESHPGAAWQFIAAACRQRWILLRLDLGRAPPLPRARPAG
jgi:hypothetical protein